MKVTLVERSKTDGYGYYQTTYKLLSECVDKENQCGNFINVLMACHAIRTLTWKVRRESVKALRRERLK